MGIQAPILQRRRGERVLITIPVTARVAGESGQDAGEEAETVVVSFYGALIRLAEPPPLGTTLDITNKFTQQSGEFRVAYVSERPREGRYEVGVEMLTPREDFWGIQFPVKSAR